MQEIFNTLSNLPADIRVPFTLFYKGVSKTEIAVQLDLSEEEIDDKIFQARKEIRNAVATDYGNIILTKVA